MSPYTPAPPTAAQCDRHSRSPQLKMISLSDVLSVVEGTTRALPDALLGWPTPTLRTPPCQSCMPLTLPHSTCLARLALPQLSEFSDHLIILPPAVSLLIDMEWPCSLAVHPVTVVITGHSASRSRLPPLPNPWVFGTVDAATTPRAGTTEELVAFLSCVR